MKRVDPDVVIARVDVDATLARLDLAAIARQVIDDIDLPEILRQSTGAVSSEAVREIRDESMLADAPPPSGRSVPVLSSSFPAPKVARGYRNQAWLLHNPRVCPDRRGRWMHDPALRVV